MSSRQERLVIAGGGIAGLALALAAGRQGIDVVLVERDPAPTADSPEAAFQSVRTGAPQAHQTHGFLARLTRVLRERFPDVLDALLDAGAHTLPLTRELGEPQPGDEDLAILVLRRTTLEWVLRRLVQAEPKVEVRMGTAVGGLVADPDPGPVPTVRGMRLVGGEILEGAVAGCTGPRGPVPAWLSAIGVDIAEMVHDTKLVYLTRWYRWLEHERVELEPRLGGDLGYLKYLAVPCDQGTFSITLAVRGRDSHLRSTLADPERFEQACRVLPGPEQFFRHGELESLGGVRPMGRLVNRLRRFTDGRGEPLVTGFHAVGDTHTCTNPLYGRGCALAFVQATLLADAFVAHPDDPLARSRTYEGACGREVEPWFHAAVQMDQTRPPRNGEQHGDGADGGGADGEDGSDGADEPTAGQGGGSAASVLARVAAAGADDPVIGRGLIRLFNLLTLPHELLTDGEFMSRVAPIVAQPPASPPPHPDGPTRADLLDLLRGGRESVPTPSNVGSEP
jgi:2-polyprenyl-6-methoxyphenol hydroxylase-like FAD-dependent oxidoreductase